MIRGTRGVKLAFVVVVLGSTPALAQSLPVVIPPVTDPRFSGLTIPANAPTQGMWSASFAWPLIGLHLSVLPDGQILSYGTPLGQSVQDGRTFDRWNPLTANVAQGHTTIGNSANVDSFCAAGILQTGGAMLVSGGDSNASSGNLSKNSTVFNYTVNTATTQSSALAQNRWYGSFIKLADGRTLITGGGLPYVVDAYQNPSGNLNNVSMTPEVWNPATATLEQPDRHQRQQRRPRGLRARFQPLVVPAQLGRAQRAGVRHLRREDVVPEPGRHRQHHVRR